MKESGSLNQTKHGTSQDNRFLEALDFDYVKIDERSFEDLLVFSTGFSKLVNYYNLSNEIEGNWSDFLDDETVILATIIDSEPNKTEATFKQHIYKTTLFIKPDKKRHYLRECFHDIYEVALKFEAWHEKLKTVEKFTSTQLSIKNEISNAIETKLSTSLRRLKAYDLGAGEEKALGEKIGLDYDIFGNIWNLADVDASTSIYKGEKQKEKIENAAESIQQIFQSFYETLLYLRRKTPDYLEQSLQSSTHYPEVALFIAFLRLYEFTQKDINDLNRRHLEFYYANILRQVPKIAKRDKVYLKFIPDDAVLFADVKAGTEFLAGEDKEGNEIIYKADTDLRVNKAQIEKLETIYLDNNPLNIKGEEKQLTSNILHGNIPVITKDTTSSVEGKRKTFATFGENQLQKGALEKTMKNGTTGFALASPSLFLKEGKREISINIQFSKDTFLVLKQYIEDISFIKNDAKREVFFKIFREAFSIYITGEKGWHPVSNYVVSQNTSKQTISIRFDISNSEPAIVKFDPSLHEGRFNTHLPIVKIVLNNSSYIYPYTLLHSLAMEQITIDTKISGVKDLLLYNNIGQLTPDNPFFPFGPLPHAGSFLLIGSNEIFQKSIDDLKVNIEWFDLPKHKSGFSGHYDEYNLGFDNTSYEAKITVLKNGRWIPENKDEQQSIKLFRTQNSLYEEDLLPKGTLSENTIVDNIDIKTLKQPPDYAALNDNLTYSATARRGFLKLELSQPLEAFGHNVYPSILSKVTVENSKIGFLKLKGNSRKKEKKLPNQPYTPQIKSISLDYTSSSSISFEDRLQKEDENDYRGQFFHIHPSGENLVYPDSSRQITYTLPQYDYQGSLMIGFRDLHPPQTVTLLFEMLDEYTVSSEDDPPVIRWSYLANNEWKELLDSKILKDDTKGFLETGIITIELPTDIKKGNTLLGPDLYWLRASAIENIEVASKTVSINTQVLTATLAEDTNMTGSHLDKPLPAGTIIRSVDNIEGVQTISQPLESFDGLPFEKPKSFYARIGERLRHKDRAIMAWDYERLVLEKFPSIYKATCLPNMNSKDLDASGSVLLVVIPYSRNMADQNEPMVSSELLYQIKSYVQELSSPFVKVEVRNPQYERIKIICGVRFADGYNYGYYFQKLNEHLNEYLGGSSFSRGIVDLGGKINKSGVISYMRTLPYVDFITQFSMIQVARDFSGKYILLDTAKDDDSDEKEFLQATKPWSVLVPARKHHIVRLDERDAKLPQQAGIDFLELGEEFII